MNLYEQQAANRRRTWLVMAAFIGLLLVIGAGFDLFITGGQGLVPIGSVAALAIGSGQAWWSLRFGDRAVLKSASARPLDEIRAKPIDDDMRLRYAQLDNVVEEMAIASGLPKPAIYVSPDSDPNAFATGRDAAHASVVVTTGLLMALNREELQGVIAHELSHVRNLDIRLMTVVAAMVGALALLADWAARSMRFGGLGRGSNSRGREKDGSSGAAVALLFAIWLVAVVLAPLLGRVLAMAVSRRREYLADATGAELTRNPLGLARALEKIEDAVDPTATVKRGTAALCIADPLGHAVNESEGAWSNLFATHPPMAKRIAALKSMAFQKA